MNYKLLFALLITTLGVKAQITESKLDDVVNRTMKTLFKEINMEKKDLINAVTDRLISNKNDINVGIFSWIFDENTNEEIQYKSYLLDDKINKKFIYLPLLPKMNKGGH